MGELHRDEHRYLEKVRDAISKKLPDVVASRDVLSAPPSSRYRFHIPVVDVPHLVPARPAGEGGGGVGPGAGEGSPGDEPGTAVWVEFTLDELVEHIFRDLYLPRPPKGETDEAERLRAEGVTRLAPPARLDIRKTAITWWKYGGYRGVPLARTMLRYHDLRPLREPAHGAVLVIGRDVSGSVTADDRAMAKVASLWVLVWVRSLYPNVRTHFVIHDTEAVEVSESDFTHLETYGGTRVSSAWGLFAKILADYSQERWARYVLYFSDGENAESDAPVLIHTLQSLVPTLDLAAYGEFQHGSFLASLIPLFAKYGVRANRLSNPGEWIRETFKEEVSRG